MASTIKITLDRSQD